MSATESLSAGAQADGRPRVLVAEKIGDSGIELLREHFDVELGVGWSREELAERIGEYDGILIRSATKLDAELIARATRLRAVGRAGVGRRQRRRRRRRPSAGSSSPTRRSRT